MKLSCLCGYKYEGKYNWRTGEWKHTEGKYPFHKIDLATCKGDAEIEASVANPNKDTYYPTEDYKVELYACPKCGTIRLAGHYALVEKDM